MMRWLLAILFILLVYLQLQLWVGEGSLAQKTQLQNAIEQQEQENKKLSERNAELATEVDALKKGTDSIEEKAREDLGMIKDGETFYMVIESEK